MAPLSGGTAITNHFTFNIAAGANVDAATIDSMKSALTTGADKAFGDA